MKSVAKQFYARMFPKFCAVALGIGSCFSRAAASKDLVEPAPAKTLAALPWSHVGAKAGAHYQGDGLAVFPTTAGARMRCVFQQLEGEATREGLWLTSIATNAVKDRFRVVVASVGRSVNADASNPLAPSIPVNLEEPRGFELRHSCAAFDTSELCPMRQGTAAVQDDIALDRTGTIKAANKLVRFTRPGLVEEYSVSMDGVRQDFVVLQRTAGAGELAVRLAVSGAKVEPAAGGARLVLENSGRKIAYSRLRVTDATGKELGARMEVEAGSTASDREADVAASRQSAAVSNSEVGGALPSRRYAPMLAVLVKDADAVYPVRIDPTFSDANWISVNPSIPGADSYVNAAVADSSGNLYIGGDFTLVGEVIANRIAKWDGSHWSPLGSGMDGSVYALAVSGSEVYAGGFFTTAGGRAANYIAKWNGSSWSALGSGMGGWVSALAVSGNDLYAAGNFTWAGGSAANGIAKWDGTSWSALGSGMDGWVSALAVSGSDVYAGGNFTMAGGSAANGIAKWNGSSWSALGSGMGGHDSFASVSALVVSGSDLYAGGGFTTAGGKVSAYIARAYLLTLPALSVLRSGTDVIVSWSSADTVGFALEQASTLSAPASWVTNTASITDDGTNKSVSLLATTSPQFFRLRR